MRNIITAILNRPNIFNRITIAMVLVPMGFVVLFPFFIKVMFEFAILLLILQNAHRIYDLVIYKEDAPVFVKLWSYSLIFLYSYGIYVIFYIANLFFNFRLTPITIGFLFFIIYGLWLLKMYNLMKFATSHVILKGETNVNMRVQFTFDEFYFPLGLTSIYFIIRFIFVSFTSTKGKQVIDSSAYPLIIIPIFMLIQLYLHGYIVDQYNWLPSTGYTSWKEFNFTIPLPDIDNPTEMSEYFKIASRTLNPPDEIFNHLYDNLETIFLKSETLEYLPFVTNFINAMGNWGRQVRDHVHLLHFVLIAQISKYRILGLIPTYKRRMFYNYLAVFSKSGIFGQEWHELIDFEAVSQKDESHTIDWVAGIRWKEYQHQDGWEMTWENTIYKGKIGYYKARKKLETVFFVRTKDDQWAMDIWDLALDYIQIFIGKQARRVFPDNLGIYNKLRYLSTGQLLDNFEEIERRKEKLIKEHHAQRMQQEINKTVIYQSDSLTEVEKREKLEEAFENKEETLPSTYRQEFRYLFSNIGNSIKNFNFKSILPLAKFTTLLLLNLLIFEGIIQLWNLNIALITFVIEFILLSMFGVKTPDDYQPIGVVASQMGSGSGSIDIDLKVRAMPILFALALAISFGLVFL